MEYDTDEGGAHGPARRTRTIGGARVGLLEGRAAALRDGLIVWLLPVLPLLFLGLPIPDTDKTISLPKLLLPALVVLWALTVRRDDLQILTRPFAWAFLLYVGWVAIAAAAVPGPWTRWHFAEEALYVLLLAGAWTRPPRDGPGVWRHFTAVCVLISLAALLLATIHLSRTALPYRVMGTPNVAAAFLVLAALAAFAEQRLKTLAVLLVGLVALGSAGAWLGLFGGAVSLRRRYAPVAVAVVLAGSLGAWMISPPAATPTGREGYRAERPRPDAFWPGVQRDFVDFWKNSVEPRVYITRLSLEAAAERPWFGVGLNTYPEAFLDVERRRRTEEQMPWWRFGSPPQDPRGISSHSDVLRIAVESGAPAAILWLIGCAALGWEIRQRPLALGLLTAFVIQSMTDNLYQLSNYVPVLWTLVGLEARPTDRAGSGSPVGPDS